MMELVRTWVMGVAAAAFLVAVAQTLMPQGPVRAVGGLTCGLVLLLAVLRPLGQVELEAGQRWLENWQLQAEEDRLQLEQDYEGRLEKVIAEQTAAYIQHEAAELGVALRSEVVCRRDDGGNFVPDSVRLYGIWGDAERNALSKIITETLDIPAQRQFFIQEGTQ